ncbi:MAG: 4Fe-4S binding protein [Deltaproteobacteria bacterium]|nr:4Fe-4S binding protein [Deltaproteobacteria bacterium]
MLNDRFQGEVREEKCVGCLSCQFYCSFRLYNHFNPLKANIQIVRAEHPGYFHIHFTDKCDGCNLCAIHCEYGALIVPDKEKRNVEI